ncbi:phospholipase A and acyltransferase 2-like [Syngnathus scovelli]|uniref:phospholipase A and acyltransferase 2-like n=1 Tax=Syngnathus scovelli TaxID=161590 RepID=UPI00210F6570|nr:phospholipase A and acyltransferase 1 isoform X5 [Syngnathus scovelli]
MDLEAQFKEIKTSAKFGDLIEFSCTNGNSHWAIYDDDGHVLHFAVPDEVMLLNNSQHTHTQLQIAFPRQGDPLRTTSRIRRVSLGEITLPKHVRILIRNHRYDLTPSSPEEIRRRFDALEDVELPYNMLMLNCEHFATFVRYGKAICNQIPTKPKNAETKSATKIFRDIVDSKDPS